MNIIFILPKIVNNMHAIKWIKRMLSAVPYQHLFCSAVRSVGNLLLIISILSLVPAIKYEYLFNQIY